MEKIIEGEKKEEIKNGKIILLKNKFLVSTEECLVGDSIELYKDVFGGEPYNEFYKNSDVWKVIQETIQKGGEGKIKENNEGKVIGFIGVLPFSETEEISKKLKKEIIGDNKIDDFIYISELGVSKSERGKGIGSKFIEEIISENRSNLILRTNKNNINTIKLYQKLGFKILKNIEDSISKESIGGEIVEQDKIFLIYKKNNMKKEININNKKFIYEIIIPGGNPTGLVELEKDYKISNLEKKEINDKIMLGNKDVEQVGFIYKDIKNPKLEMAGGEFCGNAVRASVYKYFKDFGVKIKNINVSGTENKLKTFIEKKGNNYISQTQMPIYSNPKNIEKIDKNTYIVKMDGITHIVIENEKLDNLSTEEIKIKAIKKIEDFQKKYKKLQECSCLAIIYIKNNGESTEIKPVVFVRSINTSFYETACGSGTCAVGMVEALKKEKKIELDILQPSGFIISTKIEYNGKAFGNAYIKGIIN